jgi:hypothetical protein
VPGFGNPTSSSSSTSDRRLFAQVSDADLTKLGIDADTQVIARLLTDVAHLDAMQKRATTPAATPPAGSPGDAGTRPDPADFTSGIGPKPRIRPGQLAIGGCPKSLNRSGPSGVLARHWGEVVAQLR